MKKIKIAFLHGDTCGMSSSEEKLNYLKDFLNINEKFSSYNFEYDEETPDFLFVSEHLYYGKNTDIIKKKFKELQSNNPINVFVAGECLEPDFNIFDYAIVFDRNLTLDDRAVRFPLFVKFKKSIFEKENTIKNIKESEKLLSKKNKFCIFIYSNGNAHPMRDQLFYEISKYKQVDSLGSHLRNVFEFDPKLLEISDWRLQSIKYKESYKFSISSENAQYNGYVSEKILTSLQAHTIPIYFGDKNVAEDINKDSFINVNDFKSMEDLIKYIKKVDEDDKLWCKYISSPWFTKKQLENHKKQENDYYSFLDKLFSSDKESLRRVAIGFHPQNYRNSMFDFYNKDLTENNSRKSIIDRIINKIIKH